VNVRHSEWDIYWDTARISTVIRPGYLLGYGQDIYWDTARISTGIRPGYLLGYGQDIYWDTATQLTRRGRWRNNGKVGFRQPEFED